MLKSPIAAPHHPHHPHRVTQVLQGKRASWLWLASGPQASRAECLLPPASKKAGEGSKELHESFSARPPAQQARPLRSSARLGGATRQVPRARHAARVRRLSR